jgi:hypothetical protein
MLELTLGRIGSSGPLRWFSVATLAVIGVRSSAQNGRYSTALPSNIAAAALTPPISTPPGHYTFMVGGSSKDLPLHQEVNLP